MNKKPIIIVSIIFAVLILGLVALFVVNLTTDLFKSSSEMFQRYFTKDISLVSEMLDFSNEKQYMDILKQSNYKDNTKIKVSYKNSKGNIEEFNVTSDGITNSNIRNSYRKINVKYGENHDLLNTEFIQESYVYAIRFSDVVKQFVSATINDTKVFFNKISIDQTPLEKYDFSKVWNIATSDKQTIEKICVDYAKNIGKSQYSKEGKKEITLSNGQTQTTTAYVLKLTKDQTKEIFTKVFEELSNQGAINEIAKLNNQFAETRVTIYVLEDKISRIAIQMENNELRIDLYENEIDIKYSDVNTEKINTIELNIKKQEEKKIIKYEDSEGNKINLDFNVNQNQNNETAGVNFKIQNQYIQEIGVSLEQSIETSNSNIDIQTKLANEPNVNLDNMNVTRVSSALNSLLQRIDAKMLADNNRVNSEVLNILREQILLQEKKYQGLKTKEIQDFNSQFSPYSGENVDKDLIYNMLDVVKNNILKYETIDEDKINIYIEQGKKNIDMCKEIKKIVEESQENYDIEFAYSTDGKISNILMKKNLEKKN